MEDKDYKYMKRCLELAAQGERDVLPNPMVGCVITSSDQIIAEGFHKKYGESHAEVNAINSNHEIPDDSTLYVNLEPCSHTGKTPPCADLIIAKKIRRVVIGAPDINPKVDGGGIKKLIEAGLSVSCGLLLEECIDLNKRFYINHAYRRPYVILKWAETKDGFIAKKDFSSKWISSEESRALVHLWRARETAILVGKTTAKYDNPNLTVRHVAGRNPTRIVLDSDLSLSKELNLFNTEAKTIVINQKQDLIKGNLEFIKIESGEKYLPNLLEKLWVKGLSSILVEGGTKTLQTFIDNGLWDEAYQFVGESEFLEGILAPKLNSIPLNEQIISTDCLRSYKNNWLDELKSKISAKIK
ncbi:MAG: bifunctional diaminohydroxyphosphoribosylaminopyrimidine deaminase/5-amino-6-(5-phosphoribosylamino)uracil reductase RibD [Bdellovibrionales bacterium]|nr:bifunctional diaminohydroxyphosphoribosylaminopyrimidine deaminase/5-amino-6-(5-phosphoribosylamino)uracil reductase RibD [Bdellovibrionales bacterium]